MNQKLNIAMLGHKHVLSREGGIEIVVNELATRMAEKGHQVTCYDRNTHHVSGEEIDQRREYKGVKIIPVWTIEKKGLAAMTSSLSAAWKAAWDNMMLFISMPKDRLLCVGFQSWQGKGLYVLSMGVHR